jgi:hypothetical protein
MTLHTAMSTAFPQPAPGTATSPGPMLVAPEKLRTVLGSSPVSGHRCERSDLASDDLVWPEAACPLLREQSGKADGVDGSRFRRRSAKVVLSRSTSLEPPRWRSQL